jgi:hypothetical protein
MTLWLTAKYEYDSKVFTGAAGTIFLDDEPMIWSSSNFRWEYAATADALGTQVYEASAVNDNWFGLTAINTQDMDVDVKWDKVEIAQTEFETNSLGLTNTLVQVAYNYTGNPVVNAAVLVNGKACTQTEDGVYMCELNDWGLLQDFVVEAKTPDFEQATKTSSTIHGSNTVLYVAIASAIVVVIAFFVLRRRQSRKNRETAS